MDAVKVQTPRMEHSNSYQIRLGFATLFDLNGSLTLETPRALPQCSDAEAIYSDWLAVFGDIQDVFQTVTNDTAEEAEE